MHKEPMTKSRLIELLKDVPDDVQINVFNSEGEYSANIDFAFENRPTRQCVVLKGNKPFRQIILEEYQRKQSSK